VTSFGGNGLLGGHEQVLIVTLAAFQIAAILTVPSVLLRRRGHPASAISWLLAIMAMPALGLLSWWAFGRKRIERRLRRHLNTKKAFLTKQGAPSSRQHTSFDSLLPARAQNEYVFSSPGNQLELLQDGKRAFDSILREVQNAKSCIHLQFYIFRLDRTGKKLVDLLIEKAKSGVRVRLLVDALGCRNTVGSLRRVLTPHGVEIGIFRPSKYSPLHSPRFNFVNHRKIAVVDNQVAFTGGMNIAEEYEYKWRDLMLLTRGPAVAGLHHIFLEDWFFATGEALDDPLRDHHNADETGCNTAVISSGPDTEPWILDAYFLAVTRAESSIRLATPYFIPPQALLTALRTAAGRGVDVRIYVPSHSDVKFVKWASRSYYGQLVDAGVRIFEFQGTMLHAKALLVDEAISSIGSANLDNRSLHLNFEVSCQIESKKLANQLEQWFVSLDGDSLEMTKKRLAEKGIARKLAESAAHLLSPLL